VSLAVVVIVNEERCPIMSSMGSLELLKDTPLNEKQLELTDTIVAANGVLLMLIEDILELVKMEHENKNGTKEIVCDEKFNLGDCFKSLKNIMVGYANQFSVHLEFHVDENIQKENVESNRSKFHQVISNLLTNAVKASKRFGKVELFCTQSEMEGENTEGKQMLTIKVKDYGIGIPQSKLTEIFEPFVQLHNVNESNVPR